MILFASATRLIIISNYDTATATTVASSTGAISTLLGTVVPLLPLFLPALFIILIVFRRWSLALLTALAAGLVSPAYTYNAIEGLKKAFATITDIWRRIDIWPRVDDLTTVAETTRRWLGNITASIQSRQNLLDVWNEWIWVFIFAGVALIVVLLDPPPVLRAPDSSDTVRLTDANLNKWQVILARIIPWISRSIGKLVYGGFVAIACAYSILFVYTVYYRPPANVGSVSDIARRPWLPAEEVRVTGRSDPLVGYVLSTSDGWHVLLNNDPRQIIYLRSVDVTARTVCHIKQPGEFHEPLIELEGAEPAPISTCGQ